MTTHADLGRLAEEATPGPWAVDEAGVVVVFPGMDFGIAEGADEADAAHIATWHPARALAALAVIEAVPDEHCHIDRSGFPYVPDDCDLCAALAAWNALNDPEGSA